MFTITYEKRPRHKNHLPSFLVLFLPKNNLPRPFYHHPVVVHPTVDEYRGIIESSQVQILLNLNSTQNSKLDTQFELDRIFIFKLIYQFLLKFELELKLDLIIKLSVIYIKENNII